MEMDVVGQGVYLIDDLHKIPFRPKEALAIIPESSGDGLRKEALTLFINFSVRHNGWCGVSWLKLLEEIRDRYNSDWDFQAIRRSILVMIADGLLEIPRHEKWYLRWLDMFSAEIVCPTKLLLDKIQKKKLYT